MTSPIGGGLNSAIFPNQLVTAYPAQHYDGKAAAVFSIPQINEDRFLHRVILQAPLVASDVAGGVGGAYWDQSRVPPVQAPFYLFMGAPALSNMVDLVMIGTINVGEYVTPIKVPANTELWGVWAGVLPAAATKCQATLMFAGVA